MTNIEQQKILPVIHEDVGFPYPVRRYPEVLDASEFTGIPPKIDVIPLLQEVQQNMDTF